MKKKYFCAMNISVRRSIQEDMPGVLNLIRELALYEKAPEEVTNTVEDMINDGFGDQPAYFCDVAVSEKEIIGIAVYFIKYSTWKGKGIYLDDIVVTEKWRGKGIGKMLFDNVIAHAVAMNANQLHWQVLNWNQPAINFYRKYPSDFDDEWINCKLNKSQLLALA
jgi:GNAT superfamily N-acetyltransferase